MRKLSKEKICSFDTAFVDEFMFLIQDQSSRLKICGDLLAVHMIHNLIEGLLNTEAQDEGNRESSVCTLS